jgi:hypothetical protein
MQRQSVTKLSGLVSFRFVSLILMACGLLAAGATAVAQSSAGSESDSQHDRDCSDRMLWGDYGHSSEGVVIPAPNVTLQFRSVGTAHFDGRGNFSFLEHTVINGVSQESGWTRSPGTYTVNADCTGMLTINTPLSPVPINASFVVFREGEEVREIGNSNAISTVFDKLHDRGRDRDRD